ncbi:hypothetical protein [Otariodibacter oris]|uniref:Uncharacterized protein n=1 Tax=Otariodibacter oris TaxID=1032623 RepID=A0A420XIW5_9PAST|nr:hypothetical protein [Otariodibacter oris]QGM80735.1 hypothetical protein A6A10_04605 [Otariodibacter oris]RKR77101.1 hypothetical protein DES31_0422 [Otariodibacter oris]
MIESILETINIITYFAMIISFALIIYFAYHSEQEPYLYHSLIGLLIYHLLLFVLSNQLAILSLSSIGLIIIWKLIKAYGNKITKEYNLENLDNLLSNITQEDLDKWEQEQQEKYKIRKAEIEEIRRKHNEHAEEMLSTLTQEDFEKWQEEQRKR